MHIAKQESRGHIQPRRVYFIVLFALLFLTVVTVLASYVDWGSKIGGGFTTNILIAMAIASCKAYLVLMFFMHTRYEKLEIWILGLAYPLFLFILLLGALSLDIFTRNNPLELPDSLRPPSAIEDSNTHLFVPRQGPNDTSSFMADK